MKAIYPAIIHCEDGTYWAEFPDVECCFTNGENLEEVLTNASEALGLHLSSLMDRKIELPAPSDPQALHPESGFVSMVMTDPYTYLRDNRAVKKTLSIPAWLNQEAMAHNINFSAVLQKALIAQLTA